MWKKVIIISVSVALIISVAAIISVNYVGGEIIDRAIDSEMKTLQGEIDKINAQNGTISVKIGNNDVAKDGSKENIVSTGTGGVNKSDSKDVKAEKVKLEVSKREIANKQKVITALEKAKARITAQDRMTAVALITKRLSPVDIARLEGLMTGGMDAEKRKEAVELAYSRFTPLEIVQIKELYHKYMGN
jgi:hypothetical protein